LGLADATSLEEDALGPCAFFWEKGLGSMAMIENIGPVRKRPVSLPINSFSLLRTAGGDHSSFAVAFGAGNTAASRRVAVRSALRPLARRASDL